MGWLALFALASPAIVLSAPSSDDSVEPSLQLQVKQAGGALQIKYSLHNGSQPILVYDRLLRVQGSNVVRDRQPVQRYIAGSTLRLFLGTTPDLRDEAFFDGVPDATKLAPGATLTRSVRLPLPASEYSALLPEVPKFTETQVSDIVLYMQYIPAKGVKVERSRVYPDAFVVTDDGTRRKLVRSNSVPVSLRALRVELPADFARLVVDGDQ